MPNTAYVLEDAGFTRDQVNALTVYWEGSTATKEDVVRLEGRIDTAVADLRTELKADNADLRTELKADISDLRGEMKEMYAELKADNADLRTELKADIADLRGEMKELRTELGYIKWIGAAILAGVLVPLVRDFMA